MLAYDEQIADDGDDEHEGEDGEGRRVWSKGDGLGRDAEEIEGDQDEQYYPKPGLSSQDKGTKKECMVLDSGMS